MAAGNSILFFDLEVHPRQRTIQQIGALLGGDQYRGHRLSELAAFAAPAAVWCGHNIVDHDLAILREQGLEAALLERPAIDTLYLSALLFPRKPYHRLVKDYRLEGSELSNPLADAELARALLADIVTAFQALPAGWQALYRRLLADRPGFDGFFATFGRAAAEGEDLVSLFDRLLQERYCERAAPARLAAEQPVELAFATALIATDDPGSLPPPWLLQRFPGVQAVLNRLRVTCGGRGGCAYCPALSARAGLRRFFGFEAFRRFEGDEGAPLQEQVVEAALAGDSLLAVFPTGGGKSLTFQLPALMQGAANHGLTVVISPLQSLMKDQVDVLRERHDITSAVAVSGLLSPLERGEALERVREGGANLLYIAPESLRSNTIFQLLRGRLINRFVIDEAHCFSAWGQDFRVDYLYIGPFLKKLQADKQLERPIPVSCFTATAKPAVIDDIRDYFRRELGLDLQLFQTAARRDNLHYFVLPTDGPEAKFERLTELLHDEPGAAIVYVARVKAAEQLAERLQQHGFAARAYHGQLERDRKVKIQEDFMRDDGDLDIIVATSAFGMGVDKDNVRMVVHYHISDSLENYLQESGRAGRSPDLQARCYILFDENDLNEHFSLLNSTRLSHKEVYQIWQGIKRFRKRAFTKSALEIAREAGWDTELYQLETRVKAAIAALEDAGYVRREANAPRIFAQSLLVRNVDEANALLKRYAGHFVGEAEQQAAQRIAASLISRARTGEDTRVDVLADQLGLDQSTATHLLTLFRQIGLLSKEKDLTAYFFTGEGERHSAQRFQRAAEAERRLLAILFPDGRRRVRTVYLRELNEAIVEAGADSDPALLRDILNYWNITYRVEKERIDRAHDQYRIRLRLPPERLAEEVRQRLEAARWCVGVLQQLFLPQGRSDRDFSDRRLLSFSVLDLKEQVELLREQSFPIRFYEQLLLYLHHLRVIELKSGLLIFYNPMKIVREVSDNRKRYTQEDYGKLAGYYRSKTEQIHIVGEYARRQLKYSEEAMQFADDYFTLPYDEFLERYFRNRKGKIRQPITEAKFREVFSALTPEQMQVVKDKQSDHILVAAGPGSGKTRVLVYKIASLLLMEDIKPEQFLMLTFSRPAAFEFKRRLQALVGKVAYHIDMFTYHGFAFQLAGRLGTLERSPEILGAMTAAIEREEAPMERLRNKSVLVIDEYQDVSEAEYRFIQAIIGKAERIRVVVAGDDDQNIYEFRGADIAYLRRFQEQRGARRYFLTRNFRARANLVQLTNAYLERYGSPQRLKYGVPLTAQREETGRIELTRYRSRYLFQPLIEDVLAKQAGGAGAVLTHTNEEAVLVSTLLKQAGVPARLIADQEGFALRQLLELRAFTHRVLQDVEPELGLLREEQWRQARAQTEATFAASGNLDLLRRVLAAFEAAYPRRKFRGNWLAFLREARLQDFYAPEQQTVLVSTMHKAKGKEFDQVWLLLDRYPMDTEERRRVLYVALTRARDHLYLHTNNLRLPLEGVPGAACREDAADWPAPS